MATDRIALARLRRAASSVAGQLKFPAIFAHASSKAWPIALTASGPKAAPSPSDRAFMALPPDVTVLLFIFAIDPELASNFYSVRVRSVTIMINCLLFERCRLLVN